MAKYLLLINIGPVQGFIATARRTRDLYAGSRLLSEAARAVAEVLERNGVELIFPSTQEKSLKTLAEAGIPNVIMGTVEGKDPAMLAKEAQNAAQDHLLKKAAEIFGKAGGLLQNEDAARKQVADLLEFYWVAIPYEGEKDYAKARQNATRYMAARKNTRDFAPVTWGGPVQKSSLDGALESVIDLRWKYEKLSDIPDEVKQSHEKAKLKKGIRPGEELSGVDFLKRRYLVEEQRPFASTTLMALLPFLEGLSEDERKALKEAIENLKPFIEVTSDSRIPEHLARRFPLLKDFDTRVFFPSRHRELAEDSQAAEVGEKEPWEESRRRLTEFYKRLGREPYPYYAILLADGDHMGRVIDQQKRVDDHRAISRQLAGFAGRVRRIVEKHDGSLVYSGGDDVLALLPLHTALACARELAEEFRRQLAGFCTEDGQSPTLSVGIALVHHLFDLGEAFELARRAEKKAKESRNALAVLWSPRSGVETVVQGPWCEGPRPLDRRLSDFADWLQEDTIPARFAYELKEASRILAGNGELLKREAERILKRKEVRDQGLIQDLQELIEAIGPERLASELIVARPFARAKALLKG